MFEAKFEKAAVLKKIIDAISALVKDAKFECTQSGICLRSMDGSHISLVALVLRADGFLDYNCKKNLVLGINLESLAKVLKSAGNDDIVTIKSEYDGDSVFFIFESKSMLSYYIHV